VQDAFEAAFAAWRRDGVLENAGAWITVTARRRAIDLLRRDRSVSDRAERLAALLRLDQQVPVGCGNWVSVADLQVDGSRRVDVQDVVAVERRRTLSELPPPAFGREHPGYTDSFATFRAASSGESAVPWGTSRTMTDFDVGVLLPSAVLSSGTSTLVSGKYAAQHPRAVW
jgi:hypothetical protein